MKKFDETRGALSRRDFLTSSALIAAGVAVGTLPLVAVAQRSMQQSTTPDTGAAA